MNPTSGHPWTIDLTSSAPQLSSDMAASPASALLGAIHVQPRSHALSIDAKTNHRATGSSPPRQQLLNRSTASVGPTPQPRFACHRKEGKEVPVADASRRGFARSQQEGWGDHAVAAEEEGARAPSHGGRGARAAAAGGVEGFERWEVGSEPEVSGRKRSYSDSSFMGLPKERMLPFAPDSSDWAHMMKAYGKDVIDERPRRLDDDEIAVVVPPPSKQTSIALHPPVSGKPDPVYSKWERSMSINAAHIKHHNLSRFGQGVLVDKGSSAYKDSNVGVVLVPQAAADEGSRTGMKGSGVLKILNSSSVATEKNTTGMSSSPRPSVIPQIIEPEASNVPSHVVASGARQMTIFYAGQAHVFDDVHPNKADVIMALAGSGGGSWSTNYSAKSSSYPQNTEEIALPKESQKALALPPFSQVGGSRFSLQIPDIPQASQLPIAAHVPVSSSGAHHSGGNVARDAGPATLAEPNAEGKRDI